MAYTSIHTIRATVSAAIAYITRDDKTINGVYVNSYACRADSAGASEDFRAVRQRGTGRTQILAYHMIQSFAPEEVTPEQAMQIGEELCDRYLNDNYQYVIAVHNDKEHLHCHIIFNNTNLYNGLSFTTEHNQGRKNERAWAELREISDEICKEHGLSIIKPKSKGVSHFEHDMQNAGASWKAKLKEALAEIIVYSKSFEDFLKNCAENGIEAVHTPERKIKLKFRMRGQERFTRARTLGIEFEPENISATIEKSQNYLAVRERVHNIFAKRRSETAAVTAPNTVPKTTTTHSNVITEDEFLAPLDDKSAKLTESKAPEKKEDAWASIRAMRNADEIIRNLEDVGITSFTMFTRFMWNTKHDDNHIEELSVLKKKITAIDTLIAKMKYRDKLVPIYEEYQGLSGWKQSRYRKMHSEQIEDYKQTAAYIKEHIKPFYVDGKAPKQSELQKKYTELKNEYNALAKEHNGFLVKKATAEPYIRTIRKYLEEKHRREANEQSRQRMQSKWINSALE